LQFPDLVDFQESAVRGKQVQVGMLLCRQFAAGRAKAAACAGSAENRLDKGERGRFLAAPRNPLEKIGMGNLAGCQRTLQYLNGAVLTDNPGKGEGKIFDNLNG
jgi:hypothetical protein